jgi:hypothetical protein
VTAPPNRGTEVARLKAALVADRPLWLATYVGRWGVRDVAFGRDAKSLKVLLGRQRNWTWLAYGQLEQLLAQLPRSAPHQSANRKTNTLQSKSAAAFYAISRYRLT